MTASIHQLAAFELQAPGRVHHRATVADRMLLRATEDGWSLMAHDGQLVFRGFGLAGRRQCLQFAHELGVLAVLG